MASGGVGATFHVPPPYSSFFYKLQNISWLIPLSKQLVFWLNKMTLCEKWLWEKIQQIQVVCRTDIRMEAKEAMTTRKLIIEKAVEVFECLVPSMVLGWAT